MKLTDLYENFTFPAFSIEYQNQDYGSQILNPKVEMVPTQQILEYKARYENDIALLSLYSFIDTGLNVLYGKNFC